MGCTVKFVTIFSQDSDKSRVTLVAECSIIRRWGMILTFPIAIIWTYWNRDIKHKFKSYEIWIIVIVLFLSLQQDKSESDMERIKATLMLCYGFVTLYSPPTLIISRMEATILRTINPHFVNIKVTQHSRDKIIEMRTNQPTVYRILQNIKLNDFITFNISSDSIVVHFFLPPGGRDNKSVPTDSHFWLLCFT